MANAPKTNEEKMNRMLAAWKTLAPAKQFGGLSAADFEALVNASMDARVEVAAADDARTRAVASREGSDDVTMQKSLQIVAGVVADPTEGDDSALYEAMGYVRKSNRASGLTRKKKEPLKK